MTEKHQYNDPYEEITRTKGAPFIPRRKYNGTVSSVFFNQNWNAAFMIERYHPKYDSMNKRYYISGDSGNEYIGEDRMCTILANDLSDYWRKYHPDIVEELLPRLTTSVLHSSIRILRGCIRED